MMNPWVNSSVRLRPAVAADFDVSGFSLVFGWSALYRGLKGFCDVPLYIMSTVTHSEASHCRVLSPFQGLPFSFARNSWKVFFFFQGLFLLPRFPLSRFQFLTFIHVFTHELNPAEALLALFERLFWVKSNFCWAKMWLLGNPMKTAKRNTNKSTFLWAKIR